MKAMENRERGSAGQHQGAAMKKGRQTKTIAEVCQIKPPKSEAREKVAGRGPSRIFLEAFFSEASNWIRPAILQFSTGHDLILAVFTKSNTNTRINVFRLLSALLFALLFSLAAQAQLENPRSVANPFAKGATLLDVPEDAKVYISIKSARGDKTIEAIIEKIKK